VNTNQTACRTGGCHKAAAVSIARQPTKRTDRDHKVTPINKATERLLTGADFPVHVPATTRWSDNDTFGHLNNAVYYQLFDTAINGWLIGRTGIDVLNAPYLGVVAESGCRFYREVGFPRPITIGLRVARLGRTSVTYELGLFEGESNAVSNEPVATVGHWVHVYIDRASRRAAPIPQQVRSAMVTALQAPVEAE
jgi:acyl-CoA thioester hydrolase